MRERWEEAAAGWSARREEFQTALEPVSRWLVDAIDPQPGQTVLELAAGLGDTGFLAAQRVGPDGRLISTDGAEAMVEAAKAHGAQLGITNAEFKAMELEWIDQEAASVDGVLCRFGYMLCVDPEAALRETRRVLRPGGRVALAVWDEPRHNPTFAMGSVLAELGLAEPGDPSAPGPFALADRERLVELVASAGLVDVRVEAVDVVYRAASLDEVWEQQRDLSPTARRIVPTLSPADHTRLRDALDERWSAWVQSDGSVALPGRALCAAADA